jgi:hypothetical protein
MDLCVGFFIVSVSLVYGSFAIPCALKYPSARLPAILLFVVTLITPLAIVGGPWLLAKFHTPSSMDPVGDGFDILIQLFALLAVLAVLAILLTNWVMLSIRSPSPRLPQPDPPTPP